MKCPKCIEEGQLSTVIPNPGTMSTGMCVEEYWDEQGKYHWHDPNAHYTICKCSNGHRLIRYDSTRCENCDYGREARIEVVK